MNGLTNNVSRRLYYLDHLRVSLVILVVIHHVAMVYGAGAPFYYVEPPPPTEFKAFQGLLVFILVNQSFFMGALFFLAGYFTPGSYDRKPIGAFIRDKLLRLGVPLVVFLLVLNPLSELGAFLMPSSLTGITRGPVWSDYPNLIGLGPVWFLALLLVFNGGYVLLRLVSARRTGPQPLAAQDSPAGGGAPRSGLILAFVLALAGLTYLMRMLVPLGKSVAGFPTLAYLPQYLSFFVLGSAANRNEWLKTLPVATGVAGAILAAAASVFLLPLGFSGTMFSLVISPSLGLGFGNGHWRSAVYAAWDSSFSVGLLLGLLVLFRWAFNRGGRFGRFLSGQSYAVYLIHVPVVVYVSYLFRDLDLSAIPKFLVATVVIVPVCFLLAWAIRKLPGATRLL